ncbi:protein adenylyltransferase Fic-like [Ornithodoros turicata]|uniref:Protein adenylyltransferase Fic n=1 Tax=Ornithodoros turicata TaxID=34597 RepID=A0A2R5LNC9_9ACAR
MNFNAFVWFYVKFESMVMSTHHWVMSLMFQDLRSQKYVISFGASFVIVGVVVLLVSLALTWAPSLWRLRKQPVLPPKLELTPYIGKTELAEKRSLPNFLPDSQEIQVNEEYIDVYNHLQARKRNEERERDEVEATTSLRAARHMTKMGKYEKALKLFQHAMILDPSHPDILTEYGEFLENHKKDFIKADHMYTRALVVKPDHSQALVNRQRTLPVVEKLDEKQLSRIDKKRMFLIQIPESDPSLKRMKKEAYFQHIHHTVAIEGNTMTLAETRMVVETRMAVPGKSIIEHNEILGLEAALKYVNNTLVNKGILTVNDILQMHRRVLGNVNPIDAGMLRQSQVYVGEHTPPRASELNDLMEDFVDWLNSEQVLRLHPVKYAALAHYKLVYIHPFVDGNGRTARLLMNLLLMRVGYPPVIVRKQDRALYYEYLQLGNEGDVRPFVRFIAECTERTLDVYLYATEYAKHQRALTSQDSNESEVVFINT